MEKLIAGLRHFRDNVLWEKREKFEQSTRGQNPLAMLICCSDSRVLPESLLQADPGDLFVSRNAGNLVPLPDSHGGEAASIEYAVIALGVKDIVVCGHYRCGAVKALLNNSGTFELPMMNEWLANARETRVAIEESRASALDEDDLWDRAVEQNVLAQVNNLKRHPSVEKGLADGTLRIHAWVLRFETGEVLAFDPTDDRFEPLLDRREIHSALGGVKKNKSPKRIKKSASANEYDKLSWLDILKSDLPASLVTFMVALPLCIAIAKACGAPPEAGLITGIIGGTLVGLLSGSPLQVSGPAAGLIVILLDIVHDLGLAKLGIIVLLAGILQMIAAACRLGQWFRAISPAVILGMLSGIGAVLFLQQFHVMVDDAPERSPWANLLDIPSSVYLGFANDPSLPPEHRPAALIGLMTLAILLVWKPFAPKALKVVPGVLVAVIAATAVTAIFKLPIQKVDFDHLSAGIRFVDFVSLSGTLTDRAIWIAAATIALVASAETLLCATAVDQMHRGPRTRYDKELSAQGVGNLVSGLMGGLPMTGVIVRSSANVQAGARTRWSAIFHGLWILLFAYFLPGVLRMIPTASLAAILVLTGLKLLEVHAVRLLWKESKGEVYIALITALVVVFGDLLSGVLLGVALSVFKLIYTVSRLRIIRRDDPDRDSVSLSLEGSATFLRLPKLAAALEDVPDGVTLHIDFRSLDYIDHACLTLLMNWEKQHEGTGGSVVIDWDNLRARFHRVKARKPKVAALAS